MNKGSTHMNSTFNEITSIIFNRLARLTQRNKKQTKIPRTRQEFKQIWPTFEDIYESKRNLEESRRFKIE